MTLEARERCLGLRESAHVGLEAEGPFLTITSGLDYEGPYDRNTEDLIFWHGNSAAPEVVFGRGLRSALLRGGGNAELVWRAGVDDVVHDSAVCLARDIRGSAFFPFPSDANDDLEDEHWIYAIVVPEAAATYEIQQAVERFETQASNWRNPARFTYDPTWDDLDNASCVWQFAEYAVHDVPPANIIGAWKRKRRFLVKDRDEDRSPAGIRFSLSAGRRNGGSQFGAKFAVANRIAGLYAQTYPNTPTHYLSYFGIVSCTTQPCLTRALAKTHATTVKAILVEQDGAWSFPDSTRTEFCAFCGTNSSSIMCEGCTNTIKGIQRHPQGCAREVLTNFSE